jgi:carboxylesterase
MMSDSEPFEFVSAGADSAILCVHGFTSTPYSMRGLGSYLASDSLSVYSILLPGHGTSPEDLEKTVWNDWRLAVEEKYGFLRQRYKRVFLCGQSLGSLLSLHLASYYPCAGIVSISSGVRLKDRLSALIPLFKGVIRFINKKNGPDVKDPEAKQKEIHYQKMPTRSIREIQKLLKLVKKRLPFIQAPVLFVHAAEDHIIDVKSMEWCFEHVGSEVKRKIILTNSYHVATIDYDRQKVYHQTDSFIKKIIHNQ